ncbi:MAG TPA: sodium:proton antiporter, partial [Anaeromyxobacteraceae bacterium]|nr:sodium:proton antiporter [Anaeromyxobacteraceae bacterium]
LRGGIREGIDVIALPPDLLAAARHDLGHVLPSWSVAPFALMLLSIAVLPLVANHFWEHNRNKALLSVVLGVPVALWVASLDAATLLHTAHEYVAFIILLGALYVIAGGIVVRGTLSGTPGLNTGLLGLGAVLASFIGTTGASMVLIRPLLRANAVRRRKVHVVVFFIFVVSNAGGLLTPLGDPPLFLGFLRGVPFFWTMRLFPEWLFVNGALLALFYAIDSTVFRKEDVATPGDLDEIALAHRTPISIGGRLNLLYLAGVVLVLMISGSAPLPPGATEAGMLLWAGLSWVTTRRELRVENGFTWGPIVEVAVVFAGIFATMIPALAILNARGGELGIDEPWQFFWATGMLSSFLDNAPTYLTFASAASGLLGTDAANLGGLLATERGAALLAATSLGAVLMGANTYIGNGPNFMVKAIAEGAGVRMPGFFGYLAWSAAILLPLFVAVTVLFLR